MRDRLGNKDRVIHPYSTVESLRTEAAPRLQDAIERSGRAKRGHGRRRRRRRGRPGAARGGAGTRWRVARSKEAKHRPHEGVERRAGVPLTKVGSSEAGDETVDAKAAHGLVAEAQARSRVASQDQAPGPHE